MYWRVKYTWAHRAPQWVRVAEGAENQENHRNIEDGILLVVSARIFGHTVHALVDSGATRCFISSGAVLPLGLKSTSEDTLLELGNGDRILSRGKVNDVPVVTAGLSVKLDLTVTKLLHNVDLVLGINWLQTVGVGAARVVHYTCILYIACWLVCILVVTVAP